MAPLSNGLASEGSPMFSGSFVNDTAAHSSILSGHPPPPILTSEEGGRGGRGGGSV